MSNATFVIDLDLSGDDIKEWSGESFGPRLPAGEYVFDVISCDEDVAVSSGKPVLVTVFSVVESDDASLVGVEMKKKYSLSPKALGRIKKLMNACGARLDKIRQEEIVGARIRATIVLTPGQPSLNADGTPKLDADGQPLIPMYSDIQNERPLDDQQKAQTAPPPPVQRRNNAASSRRA